MDPLLYFEVLCSILMVASDAQFCLFGLAFFLAISTDSAATALTGPKQDCSQVSFDIKCPTWLRKYQDWRNAVAWRPH